MDVGSRRARRRDVRAHRNGRRRIDVGVLRLDRPVDEQELDELLLRRGRPGGNPCTRRDPRLVLDHHPVGTAVRLPPSAISIPDALAATAAALITECSWQPASRRTCSSRGRCGPPSPPRTCASAIRGFARSRTSRWRALSASRSRSAGSSKLVDGGALRYVLVSGSTGAAGSSRGGGFGSTGTGSTGTGNTGALAGGSPGGSSSADTSSAQIRTWVLANCTAVSGSTVTGLYECGG